MAPAASPAPAMARAESASTSTGGARRRDPVHYEVDHLAGEAVTQRQMTLKEPVVRGPEDQVQDHVRIGPRRDLPPPDRLVYQGLLLSAQGVEHPLAPRHR